MAIKLSILKTGEYIISDVFMATEKDIVGKETLVCYVLKNPKAILVMDMSHMSSSDEQGKELQTSVSLLSWPQFTETKEVEVQPDAFVTFADPNPELVKLYEDSLK
jgi:hypothetical protein